MMEEKINVPAVPELQGLPESKKQEWRDGYARAFKQAQVDHPEDPLEQRATAVREANRIFRVGEVASYEQAMALPDWQVHINGDGTRARFERNGELRLVTIDGGKFSFPIPRKSTTQDKVGEE